MKGTIRIKRNGRYVTFTGDYSANISVIRILEELNLRENLTDINGNSELPIEFDCGCHEGVCGVCAMVVNGVPCLPCSSFFGEVGPEITIEPLSKFPLVHDLKVNRLYMEKHLVETGVWLDEEEALVGDVEAQYISSSCLHCGCCLEVCPNYNGKDEFFGSHWMNKTWVICSQIKDKDLLLKEHAIHGSSGCSKNQACAKVCPKNIQLPLIISTQNRARIKSIFSRKK